MNREAPAGRGGVCVRIIHCYTHSMQSGFTLAIDDSNEMSILRDQQSTNEADDPLEDVHTSNTVLTVQTRAPHTMILSNGAA